jgi:hypothetical protein
MDLFFLETDNQLNDQTSEYENITTLYPIEQPQLPILRTVNNDMPHGNVQADGNNNNLNKLKSKANIFILITMN